MKTEFWDDGVYMYTQAHYPATKQGAEAAEKYESFAAAKGFAPIDVQLLSGTDFGRSVAKSAVGLGLLAATGFGFLGTSRKEGELVVTYRSVLSIADMMAAQGRAPVGEIAYPPETNRQEAPNAAQEMPRWSSDAVDRETIERTKRLRAVLRSHQKKDACKKHPGRPAARFLVEFPGRKAHKVWLCTEDAAALTALGATLRSPDP